MSSAKGLRRKFLLLFFAVISVWVVMQIIVYRFISTNIIETYTSSIFDRTLFQMSHRVNSEIVELQNLTVEIRNRYVVRSALRAINEENSVFLERANIVRDVLRISNITSAENVYIFVRDNAPINCYYGTPYISIPDEYALLLGHYNDLLGDEIDISVENTDAGYVVRAKAYILDGDNVLGLLVVEFGTDTLDSIIMSNRRPDDRVFLLDTSNIIVYANDKESINKRIFAYFPDDNYMSYELESNGWLLVGNYSESTVEAEMRLISGTLIIFSIVTLALFLVVPITIEQSFYKQIKKLLVGMEYIKNGDLNFVVESSSNNEFKAIFDNFNSMVRHIKELMHRNAQQQKLYHRAEIEVLQARLNPHFLFNTLDIIHWKLIMDGKSDISDMIVNLADILRYSISNSEENVTIAQDMDFLDKYLTLQRARFNNNLNYEISVEDSVKPVIVPRLFIQPIAENSIKYAFKDMSKHGNLRIAIYEQDSYICIMVADDGEGMDEERVKLLNDSYRDGNPETGLGLQLAYKRISDMYKGCEMKINSRRGEGTSVEIRFLKEG